MTHTKAKGEQAMMLCKNCVYETHPVMLTTYCIPADPEVPCPRCGSVTDLAITTQRLEEVKP